MNSKCYKTFFEGNLDLTPVSILLTYPLSKNALSHHGVLKNLPKTAPLFTSFTYMQLWYVCLWWNDKQVLCYDVNPNLKLEIVKFVQNISIHLTLVAFRFVFWSIFPQ